MATRDETTHLPVGRREGNLEEPRRFRPSGPHGFTDNPEDMVSGLLYLLGLDPLNDPHLLETPRRVVGFLREFINPQVDLLAILKSGFKATKSTGIVIQTRIPLRGLCPHHLLPFAGEAAVGYIPCGRVVGLSKLARLVDAAGTMQPATQEDITELIADTLYSFNNQYEESSWGGPKGVAVVTTAKHPCITCRGVRAIDSETKYSALRGVFFDNSSARAEFYALIKE